MITVSEAQKQIVQYLVLSGQVSFDPIEDTNVLLDNNSDLDLESIVEEDLKIQLEEERECNRLVILAALELFVKNNDFVKVCPNKKETYYLPINDLNYEARNCKLSLGVIAKANLLLNSVFDVNAEGKKVSDILSFDDIKLLTMCKALSESYQERQKEYEEGPLF